jgi:type III restriction enzyme
MIWLTEVAPAMGARSKKFFDHVEGANAQANPELLRLAMKMATGSGKTTVMAMLIAWQTVNAVRHPNSKRFSLGFLVVTPGITIKDRLRVLQPNDPDSYYRSREFVPDDMLPELAKAKIVIAPPVLSVQLAARRRHRPPALQHHGCIGPYGQPQR